MDWTNAEALLTTPVGADGDGTTGGVVAARRCIHDLLGTSFKVHAGSAKQLCDLYRSLYLSICLSIYICTYICIRTYMYI